MKRAAITLTLCAMFITSHATGTQRFVLAEVFTNSFCPLCVPAHNAIKAYNANDDGSVYVNYIFYHNRNPYPSDPLYLSSMSDSDMRSSLYNGNSGPFSATPVIFIDGANQGNTFSETTVNNRISVTSPLEILLSGSRGEESVVLDAQIRRIDALDATDLVLHIVVVENITTEVGNQPSRDYVMRMLVYGASGSQVSIGSDETLPIEQNITLDTAWITANVGFVVFIQRASTREVYQSAYIGVDDLTVTGVDDKESMPSAFRLHANYPNPFNPSTIIEYEIPEITGVTLVVFNAIGQEIATLVNESQFPGRYAIQWNGLDNSGRKVTSGIYFYRLRAGTHQSTKRMVLVQ
jgi:hypothetical protein